MNTDIDTVKFLLQAANVSCRGETYVCDLRQMHLSEYIFITPEQFAKQLVFHFTILC